MPLPGHTCTSNQTELQQLEKDSFIQIIMGVKPVSYFDTFVKEWYEQGGEELTEQIHRSNPGE